MSDFRRRQRSMQEDAASEINLEQFKKLGLPVIQYINHRSQTKNNITRHRKISYQNNSLVLAVTANHITEMITSGNIKTLLKELQDDIPLKSFKLIPSEFNKSLDTFNIKFILKNCCLKISEAKTEMVELETSKIINQYPFFRICLVLWARNKALNHLELYKNDFSVLLGNQKEILMDFGHQLRYITLDLLAQSFGLKILLFNEGVSEVYGQEVDEIKELSITLGDMTQSCVYIEDMNAKQFSTNNTQTSTEQTSTLKVPNKNNNSIDVFSSFSPRSVYERMQCLKCGSKMRYGRCNNCKQQSTQKLKKIGKFQHYVSLQKVCQGCGKKQIIYKGEVCRKCQMSKSH